jgi:hypothetical protein
VRGLLQRLIAEPVLRTDLPSSGRATVTRQAGRHILHLYYGAPQVRGKDVRSDDGSSRVMDMIEDVPALGPVTASLRLPASPTRVFDALSGEAITWSEGADGRVDIALPRLHIHRAVVFEGT